MSNEIAKIPYGELVMHQLTPQHQAWIGMAEAKNDLVAELTQAELNAQSLLVVRGDDYKEIDTALANYRKAHADMVELRKGFTNQIDAGIIQPLMAFEKRVDPKTNELYTRLSSTSLSLRKAEADKVTRANQVNAEIAQFKTHCSNEYFRVAADYRTAIRREITNQYQYWLKQGTKPDMDKLRAALQLVQAPDPIKFKPTLITREQMAEAHKDLHTPDFEAIYQEMLEEVDEVFANFSSDLANKEAAIAKQEEATQLAEIKEQSKLTEETAINTLIVTSEAVVIETPSIKRNYQIVVVESEAWAKAVIAGFIANLPALSKYIRVKSWAKLTIGQMAEYLAKLATEQDVRVASLQYAEIEK